CSLRARRSRRRRGCLWPPLRRRRMRRWVPALAGQRGPLGPVRRRAAVPLARRPARSRTRRRRWPSWATWRTRLRPSPAPPRAPGAAFRDKQPPGWADAVGAESPGLGAADVAAYGRWVRNGARRGRFECAALAKADAPPEMAADARVIFKESPDPKALSPGLA